MAEEQVQGAQSQTPINTLKPTNTQTTPVTPMSGSVSAIVKDLNGINSTIKNIVNPITKKSVDNIVDSVKTVNNGYKDIVNSVKSSTNDQDQSSNNSIVGVIKNIDGCINAIVNIFSKSQQGGNSGEDAPLNEVINDYDKKVAESLVKISTILQRDQFLDEVISQIIKFEDRWNGPLKKRFGMIKVIKKTQDGMVELVDEKQTTSIDIASDIIKLFSSIIGNLILSFDNTSEISKKVMEGGYGMYHTITFLDGMITMLMKFDEKWFPILNNIWGKTSLKKMLVLKNDNGGEFLQEIEENEFKTNSYTLIIAVLGNVTKCLELIQTILDDKNISEVINNPENIKKKLSSLTTIFEDIVNTVINITTKLNEVIKSEDQAKGIVVVLTSIGKIFENMFEMTKLLDENAKTYKGSKYIKLMKSVRAFIDASIELIIYISKKLVDVTQNTEDAKKNIEDIISILKNLVQIPLLLIKLVGTFILAVLTLPLILISLDGVRGLVIFITWLFKDKNTLENAQKNIEDIISILKNLVQIPLLLIKIVGVFALALLALPLIIISLIGMRGLIIFITLLFSNNKAMDEANGHIEIVIAVLKNLIQIPILLIKLAGVFILALLLSPVIMLALVSIYGMIKFMGWLFNNDELINTIEKIKTNIDNVLSAIKSLVKLCLQLILLALIAPFAIIAMIVVMVFMGTFMLFILGLKLTLTTIDKLDGQKLQVQIDHLFKVIKALSFIAIVLILLAPIAALAIIATVVALIFVGVLVVFVLGLKLLLTIIDNLDGKKTIVKLWRLPRLICVLGLIALSLILLAPIAVLAIIATVVALMFMGVLIVFVMGLKLMLIIIDKFDGRKTRAKLWGLIRLILILNLVALSLILLAVVSVVAVISMVVIIAFMIGLTLLILVIWLIAWLLSKVITKRLIIQLKSLVLVIFILLIISAMILGIALIATVVAPHWLDILIFMGVMLGVIVIAIAIGWLAMLATPIIGIAIVGLFLILVLMGIILGIALCLKLIAEIDLDPDAVMKGVKTVLDTAWFVVENVFNPDKNAEKKDGGEENRGFFGWIADRFKDIIGGIAAIITLLLGIVYLVLVFVAIGLILMIAGCLYLLQQIELNPDLIKSNVEIVLATGDQVINSIFNRQDPETNQSDGSGRKGFGDWIMETLGSILGGIGKIMKLILSILYLVMLFIAIGLITGIVAALNKIAEFNLNSGAIKAKVTAIFDCAQTVMDKVYETKESNKGKNSGGFWANVLKGLGFSAVGDLLNFIADYAYLSRVLSSIQLVSKLANSLNTIKDISVKEDAIKKSISSIFRLSNLVEIKLKGVTTKNMWEQEGAAKHLVRLYQSIKLAGIEISKIPIDLESNLQVVDNILKVIKSPISKEALTTHKEMIENYIKFLDKVDRVDIENLRTTERLFKNMAQFSESIKGNFQGLADALNEKIAPLLEELKDLLKEVKPSIEQASKDTQASITDNATGNTERAAQRAGMPLAQVQQARQTEENKKRANYERLAAIDKIVKLLEGEYKNGAKVRMN